MLGSTLLQSPASSSGVLVGSSVVRGDRSERKGPIVVRCERNYPPFPKVQRPMGRPTLLDQFIDQMPLVDKTKHKLTDYCTTVEGDECCSCWDAYFELRDLEEKWPAEKFNSFLRDNSHKDMNSLISVMHYVARIENESDKESGILARIEKKSDKVIQETTKESEKRALEIPRHIPDGLPKTQEEIEEEEKALMPSSDFTRLLRSLRVYPSWYIARPDVETD